AARAEPGELHPPEVRNVPLDELRDTHVDLRRVARARGDRLVVRASLVEGDAVVDQALATFELEVYGHYATISPAVVLVRPDSLGGASTQFAFAPTLSWMHGYRPRPERSGFLAGFLRAFEPALGIHAIFLNFDPDEAVEIGLGATVSFWGNRLQGGVGYNLTSEDGLGDVYYFVGSDLISLLQDVGIAEP
ncbi:MAG TPA: hypothetical protein VJP77_06150, partial [Planctomycetota bacterium]|nr:hypothetical protein [Planctomycetota bacterium]